MSSNVRRGAVGLACALALFVVASSQAQGSLASLGYAVLRWFDAADVVHHEIDARVDPEALVATFSDAIVFESAGKRAIHFLLGVDAHVERALWTDGGVQRELGVSSVLRLSGLPFTLYRVQLPRTVPRGEQFELVIEWRMSSEEAAFLNPFAAPDFFYVGYATLWYPHMPNEDFFTAAMNVTVPPGFSVIGDGAYESGETQDGWVRHRYLVDRPVNRIGFGVGRFDKAVVSSGVGTVGEVRVEAWRPVGHASAVDDVARWTAEAVAVFQELLGPLPDVPHHAVEIPFGFPTSYAGLYGVVYGGDLASQGLGGRQGRALMAAHEAAHKWIGGVAGVRVVGHAWLAESLAEYLGHVALRHLLGREEAALVFERRVYGPFVAASGQGRPRSLAAIEIFDDDAGWLFQKGTLVFRMLHRLLGDDAFFGLLRAFIADYEMDHASGDDFIRFAVDWAARGDAAVSSTTLRRFFDAWIRGTGRLDLALVDVKTTAADDAVQLAFTVASVGNLDFPGTAAVKVETADGAETWLDVVPGRQATVELLSPPVHIVVDPWRELADVDPANNEWRQP